MPKTNFSLDLETLGTTPGSVIFAIGCVAFDSSGAVGQFYSVVNINDSVKHGFTVGWSTLGWWREQSPEARKHLDEAYITENGALDTLTLFSEWVTSIAGDVKNVVMWGNGSEFDNAFLAAYYGRFCMDPPWYKGSRCLRTIKEMYPGFEPAAVGTVHNALDDAEHQGRWIARILNAHAPHMLPHYERPLS